MDGWNTNFLLGFGLFSGANGWFTGVVFHGIWHIIVLLSLGMISSHHGNLRGPDPPKATWKPQEIAGPNKALFIGGNVALGGGAPLDSHESM